MRILMGRQMVASLSSGPDKWAWVSAGLQGLSSANLLIMIDTSIHIYIIYIQIHISTLSLKECTGEASKYNIVKKEPNVLSCHVIPGIA